MLYHWQRRLPLRTLLFRTAVAFVGATVGFTTGATVVSLPPQEVLLSPVPGDTVQGGATTVPLPLPSPAASLAMLLTSDVLLVVSMTLVLLEASTVEFSDDVLEVAMTGCVA